MGKEHILKNLYSLIRNKSMLYTNEFIWQDIELTEEFKLLYKEHLDRSNYDIEFLGSTAVITSPSLKNIYVPNQWFVIASYAVDVYEELQTYKNYFKLVSDELCIKQDVYAKRLRDNANVNDRDIFTDCARKIFSSNCDEYDVVEEATSRLWRFVNDYSWWSGHKTIDRGDFYVSVILNMLNLVNTSQGYVADIVSVYASNYKLRNIVKSIDGFTNNICDTCSNTDVVHTVPDEEIRNKEEALEKDPIIPKPTRVRIKINGESTFKELNYKV
jgi:hypothetical protein